MYGWGIVYERQCPKRLETLEPLELKLQVVMMQGLEAEL